MFTNYNDLKYKYVLSIMVSSLHEGYIGEKHKLNYISVYNTGTKKEEVRFGPTKHTHTWGAYREYIENKTETYRESLGFG